MNSIKTLTITALITLFSLNAFAAEKIKDVDSSMEKVATVSILGASTPD